MSHAGTPRVAGYATVLIVLAAGAQLLAQSKGANPVADPGFEAGAPNPFWSETSTNFGTPICDATCNDLFPPFMGDYFAWFGGLDNGVEEGSLSQDVTFGTDASDLTFWLRAQTCPPDGDPGHFMEVLVDGTQVYRIDADSPICGDPNFTQQRVDVSAWADGSVHTVAFHAILEDGGNFFVDEVALDARAPLAAYWPFDGDTRDASGRGRHGTLEGAAAFGPGVSSLALDLRAGDGWVDVVSPVLDGAEECTIAYWVRFASLVPGDPTDPLSAIYAEDRFDSKALHSNLAFWTDPDTLEWHIAGNPERASILAPTSAPTSWMHLAMAYSSITGLSEIYVNGVLAGTQTHATPALCGSGSSSQIGAWVDGSYLGRFLDGQIDEMRLYTERLTADEVGALASIAFADGFESGDLSAWSAQVGSR